MHFFRKSLKINIVIFCHFWAFSRNSGSKGQNGRGSERRRRTHVYDYKERARTRIGDDFLTNLLAYMQKKQYLCTKFGFACYLLSS